MFLVRFTVILTRFYPAVVLFMYRLLLCYVNCGFGIKWRRPSLLLIWLNMYRGHLCCLSLLEEATFPCYYQEYQESVVFHHPQHLIGHFRVPPGLCIKTRVGAQPLIWK